MKMAHTMNDRTERFDPSRWRVAEAVIDRLRAGESVASIADDYGVHEAYILAVLLALERGGLIIPTRAQR